MTSGMFDDRSELRAMELVTMMSTLARIESGVSARTLRANLRSLSAVRASRSQTQPHLNRIQLPQWLLSAWQARIFRGAASSTLSLGRPEMVLMPGSGGHWQA